MLNDWHKKTWLGENNSCPCANKQLRKWVEILSVLVGPAPLSAVPREEEPQQSSVCLWGVSCSLRGWASGPPMAGEAEEHPCVLKMSPASWHEGQKRVLCTELCLNRILICNYRTSCLATTNCPLSKAPCKNFILKRWKALKGHLFLFSLPCP